MKIDGSMFNTINIASSGLRAYNRKMELIGSNVTNMQTTDAGNGQPYRRLVAEFKAAEVKDGGLGGVELGEIKQDPSDFQYVLDPGHPNANADGYVAMPNVSLAQEMIDLNVVSKAYQANASILKRYQKMMETSLELLR
jgi:flagellar basal-body rod protein FlgC